MPVKLRAIGDGYVPDDGKRYTQIFNDEFSGTSLDRTKWWTRHKDNGGKLDYYNDELQRYIDNHVVGGGVLKLTAKSRATIGHAPSSTGIVYHAYDSSMVRSRVLFQYGYVEFRAKLPPGLGVWPAGWILSQSAASQVCEIDSFEYVRNDVTEFSNMIHGGNTHNVGVDNSVVWKDPGYNDRWAYYRQMTPWPSSIYHVIGTLWEPGMITQYINGKPIVQRKCEWKNKAGVDGGMASIIINLAMGGSWPTNNWTTKVSMDTQVLEMGSVRVWQQEGSIITGVSPV